MWIAIVLGFFAGVMISVGGRAFGDRLSGLKERKLINHTARISTKPAVRMEDRVFIRLGEIEDKLQRVLREGPYR